MKIFNSLGLLVTADSDLDSILTHLERHFDIIGIETLYKYKYCSLLKMPHKVIVTVCSKYQNDLIQKYVIVDI